MLVGGRVWSYIFKCRAGAGGAEGKDRIGDTCVCFFFLGFRGLEGFF